VGLWEPFSAGFKKLQPGTVLIFFSVGDFYKLLDRLIKKRRYFFCIYFA
jgi:hypothetical protein